MCMLSILWALNVPSISSYRVLSRPFHDSSYWLALVHLYAVHLRLLNHHLPLCMRDIRFRGRKLQGRVTDSEQVENRTTDVISLYRAVYPSHFGLSRGYGIVQSSLGRPVMVYLTQDFIDASILIFSQSAFRSVPFFFSYHVTKFSWYDCMLSLW